MRCLWLLVANAVAAAGVNEARARIPFNYGRGLGLRAALNAVSRDEDLTRADVGFSDQDDASPTPQSAPSGDVSQLSREVANLQAKLATMNKMDLLQAAETKAAVTGLEERLLSAEEKSAEEDGELEVSEKHSKDLAQQLAKEMARRKMAEEQVLKQKTQPVSFLQVVTDEVTTVPQGRAPQESKLAMVAVATEGSKADSEAEAMSTEIKLASNMVQKLKVEKLSLQQKLAKQKGAVNKAKLDINRRQQSVASLKARSANLEQLMQNMDQADAASLRKVTSESDRALSYVPEMDAEISKARLQKQELEERVAELESQRSREEKRAKNQVAQAKQIAIDAEQADSELKSVKQEVLKTKERIYQEQTKAATIENELAMEEHSREAREHELAKTKADFESNKQKIASMAQTYKTLLAKSKKTKSRLAHVEKNLQEQEQKAQRDLESESLKARRQAKADAAALARAQKRVMEETEKTESEFKVQVQLVRKKYEDEIIKGEQRILKDVKIQKRKATEKINTYQREVVEEQKTERAEASAAVVEEAKLQQAMKKAKQEAHEQLEQSGRQMNLLEMKLDEQKTDSSRSIAQAKRAVQSIQREVLEEQDAMKAKQTAVLRKQVQASEMAEKATLEEKLEAVKERELGQKIQEALEMETKGKLVLQRQAKARVAQLRKMISEEEALEKEQVAALKKQIVEANRSASASLKSRSFLQKS